ncbi:Gfo/Idh/MocA family protein [Ructibacterium gallinarum]|nr:Gfo/Idh/MocA family oxidoreductase [Ructibacterium gallinarum]
MTEKLKVGIIGTGNIAGNHIAAYQKNPNVELYAFCDIDEERLKNTGKKYGVTRLFTDKDEMLKLKELDAVSVCTWNSAHAPCTIAALNAGKHVLCEKPMALNAKEAEEMNAAAKKNGKLLMIGFVRRYGNDCKVLQDFINHDALGEIYYAKATYLRRNGNPGGWFGDKSRSGGGPLIDLGVHVIDLVRYLSGNPLPVSVYGATFQKLFDRKGAIGAPKYTASSATDHDICDVEDLASAMIRFDNGEVLSIEASFSLNIKNDMGQIELFGTKAGAKLSPELEIYGEDHHYLTNISFAAPTELDFCGLFENEIDHFVDCITEAASVCKSPAEDGITLMKILDAVYESARTGHEIIIG